jgi:hypothetical protein
VAGTPPSGSMFANLGSGIVEVNVKQIRAAFEASISSYEKHIRLSASEQSARFEPMHDKYGWIWICEYHSGGSLSTMTLMASGG